VTLGELANIIAGQSPPGSTYRREPVGLPFFQGKADFGDRHPVARVWCTEPNKIAQPGDVLMSIRAPVGPTNVADTECCIGRGLAALRCGPTLDRDYSSWFLRCIEADIAKQGSGSTFDAINRDQLEALEIPLPPLAEQERIAGRLTEQLGAVERARAAAAQRLAAAEALPAALLREVFDGPQASGWETVRLGDVAFVSGGVQKSPGRAPREHHRPYLTVRNVQRGFLDLTSVERFEVTPSELERLRLERGDILIVEGNGSPDHIGRNAVFDLEGEEWVHQNHVIRVRLGERASHQYVSTYLNSPAGRSQMMEKARSTSGLYTLSTEKVNSLEIPLPDLPTQRRLAADLTQRLAAAEGVIARCREELAAIEALPAALLRDAFGQQSS
jgi:type I restriction enzyme S subunit